MAFSLSATAFAANKSTTYKVSSSTTKSTTFNADGGTTGKHGFVKGGLTSADYIYFQKGATHGVELTGTLKITSSNGKTTSQTFKNCYVSGKGIVANFTSENTKTKGKLWKSTKSTNSKLTVVGCSTDTWTVTGS